MKALTAMVDDAKPAERKDTLDDVVAAAMNEPVDAPSSEAPPTAEVHAEIPSSEPPPAAEAHAEIPSSEPTEAHAEIPSSEPTEAHAEIIPSSEATKAPAEIRSSEATEAPAEIPSSEPTAIAIAPAPGPVSRATTSELDYDLERLMAFEEATAATQRAEEAEHMQEAVNRLVKAMLKKGSLSAEKSAKIQAVLGRRDSIDDIAHLAADLEQQADADAQLVLPHPAAAGSQEKPPPMAATPPPTAAAKAPSPTPAPTDTKSAREDVTAPPPPCKAEPEQASQDEKSPEEIEAEWQAKERKRLAHNSYMRYGRSLRNSS